MIRKSHDVNDKETKAQTKTQENMCTNGLEDNETQYKITQVGLLVVMNVYNVSCVCSLAFIKTYFQIYQK